MWLKTWLNGRQVSNNPEKGSFTPSPSPRKRTFTLSINTKSNRTTCSKKQNIDTHHQGLSVSEPNQKHTHTLVLLWLAFNNTTSSPPISCTLVHNHNKLLLSPLCFPSKPLMFKITLSLNNHLGPMPPLLPLLFFLAKRVILLLPLTTSSPNSHQTHFLACFGSLMMKIFEFSPRVVWSINHTTWFG